MELHVKLSLRIDEIQKKLRECNYQCNRLKDEIVASIPELLTGPDVQQDQKADQGFSIAAPVISPPAIEISTVDVPAVTPPKAQSPDTAENTGTEPELPAIEIPLAPASDSEKDKRKSAPKRELPQIAAIRGNRSWEEFIGGNLLNKVGIGILIIGIGIFVKYAIDQDWIGSVGRVLIGLLSGGILMGLAHRLRNSYKAFSSVLLGGGIAVLYFSIAIAFHQYELLSQTAAFGIMCVITGAAVFFSISYNRQEIAVLALLGAFVTPFLVNTGSGNYVALFSYLLIVNVGMIILSWFRNWDLVRILSYMITLVLFGGWLSHNHLFSDTPVYGGAIAFGTAFFLIFFAMNLAFNVRKQKTLGPIEYVMLLSNTMLYYAGSMWTLSHVMEGKYMGLFTVMIAVFHFAFVFPVRKLLAVDRHLPVMLIGLVLTFCTLAIPIQLEGNYITLFWAAEAVILLILAQRTGIKLLRTGSQVVSVLALIGLVWDWSLIYFDGDFSRPAFLNGAFLTSMLTTASLAGMYYLYKRDAGKHPENASLSLLYQFSVLPILYVGILVELVFQLMAYENEGLVVIGVIAYTATFLSIMQGWALYDRREEFGKVILGLSTIGLLVFFGVHAGILSDVREAAQLGYPSGDFFKMHFLMVPPLFALLALNFLHLKRHVGLAGQSGRIVVWAVSIAFIVLSSMELENMLVMGGISLETARKVGFPILWGLTGFVMILLGMQHKLLQLRIAGLSLFALILVKLFAYDIRTVSTGGKIAAFILLGVLFLVISFMYQKLKKLLVEGGEAE